MTTRTGGRVAAGLGIKHAHDDSVEIDAKAGEISHVLHRADASNGSDCLCLVGIGDVHGTLGTSMQVLADLPVDQGWVLLRKADRRIDGIGLVVKTPCFFGCEISRQHMGCRGLRDVLEDNS